MCIVTALIMIDEVLNDHLFVHQFLCNLVYALWSGWLVVQPTPANLVSEWALPMLILIIVRIYLLSYTPLNSSLLTGRKIIRAVTEQGRQLQSPSNPKAVPISSITTVTAQGDRA